MSGSSNGLHHPVALGIVLILVGAAMTVIGFVYGLSEVTGWPGPLMFAGLTAVPLGGALILWRMLVRFRRRGWFAEMLRFTGLVVLVFLLAAAAYAIWWMILSFRWDTG